jgi:hypothetical protein
MPKQPVTTTTNQPLVNFTHLAKHAPTDAARAFWEKQAKQARKAAK